MAPYYITLIFIIFVCSVTSKFRSLDNAVILFLTIVSALFFSLRDYSVGSDTLLYLLNYNYLPINWSEFSRDYIGIFKESAFFILEFFIKRQDFEFYTVLFIISIFVYFLTYKTIYRYSDNIFLTVFLYITLGFFLFGFNAARQSITVALFLFSVKFIINRDFTKYTFVILIGFFFHKSIILCLPCYFLYRKVLSFKYIIIIGLAVLLLSATLNQAITYLANNVDVRYTKFSETLDQAMGTRLALINILIFSAVFIQSFFSKYSDTLNLFINLSFIGVLISSVSVLLRLDPNGLARAAYYFTQFFIFLVPVAISNIRNQQLKMVFYMGTIGFCLFYFHSRTSIYSGLYPYIFRT
ncbi:hypothetical protein A6E01_17565 [Vibrio breoganii]|uniref:EpsG family protein n=1 Tax=Vibrio breoganii TaxID=553239 RepID=A0AAN1CTT6_9VIBR|nr:hypothetical protein A6E01_17565 [Vibrio breoganii]